MQLFSGEILSEVLSFHQLSCKFSSKISKAKSFHRSFNKNWYSEAEFGEEKHLMIVIILYSGYIYVWREQIKSFVYVRKSRDLRCAVLWKRKKNPLVLTMFCVVFHSTLPKIQYWHALNSSSSGLPQAESQAERVFPLKKKYKRKSTEHFLGIPFGRIIKCWTPFAIL